jgi:hypothetical protein
MSRVNPFAVIFFEIEVEQTARKLWALIVQKVGKARAKNIMRRVMDDGKPGPRNPQEGLLNSIIEACISNNANESDEKIAKRILARKLCFVRYQSGAIGIAGNDELDRGDVINAEDGVIDIVVEWEQIGKDPKSLKKRVERIRRRMIEDGALPKEYAPRQYYRG